MIEEQSQEQITKRDGVLVSLPGRREKREVLEHSLTTGERAFIQIVQAVGVSERLTTEEHYGIVRKIERALGIELDMRDLVEQYLNLHYQSFPLIWQEKERELERIKKDSQGRINLSAWDYSERILVRAGAKLHKDMATVLKRRHPREIHAFSSRQAKDPESRRLTVTHSDEPEGTSILGSSYQGAVLEPEKMFAGMARSLTFLAYGVAVDIEKTSRAVLPPTKRESSNLVFSFDQTLRDEEKNEFAGERHYKHDLIRLTPAFKGLPHLRLRITESEEIYGVNKQEFSSKEHIEKYELTPSS